MDLSESLGGSSVALIWRVFRKINVFLCFFLASVQAQSWLEQHSKNKPMILNKGASKAVEEPV